MNTVPYEQYLGTDLILRDTLAIDRTLLAAERTFLAYIRTALTLVIAGMTFFHFVSEGWLRVVGIAFIPSGIFVSVIGFWRYSRRIYSIRRIVRGCKAKAQPGPGE